MCFTHSISILQVDEDFELRETRDGSFSILFRSLSQAVCPLALLEVCGYVILAFLVVLFLCEDA